MYVRIENHHGFIIKGFRSQIVGLEDFSRARKKLLNSLDKININPRVTYGVILSPQSDMLTVEAYIAGIIGNSSMTLNGMQEVLISSGRYVIASMGNETYDVFELLTSLRDAAFFRFRQAPIVEKYIRNTETGECDIELWVPIE
ncbi:hypothetical protein [Kurthia sibirica]|uniref:Bacterial transcription activator effector binding domain-containing protein n=1 Tax=Kurthia sibirica TaxID=202750 RepID=A0A2U3AKM5_9BACL|nr:hypothetical protein [Kurthia sibirica]PWI25064.1 hypothetical protein DEX24_09975 [Kurthia sibirica]GEK34229.1 hypothetical protein KSI01_17620 [Kurthia sibirica]